MRTHLQQNMEDQVIDFIVPGFLRAGSQGLCDNWLHFPLSTFMLSKQVDRPSQTSVAARGKAGWNGPRGPLQLTLPLLANVLLFYLHIKEESFVPPGCSPIQVNLGKKPLKY